MAIHPTAIIDASARLGGNVQIGPYAIIGPGVVLGDGCTVGAHAQIEYAEFGPECQIFPGAMIGFAAQHLRYAGEPAKVVVGKKTVFREGVTVHRGTPFDKSVTTIGDNGYFMAMSHIAHDCRVGNNVTMANGSVLGGHVTVEDNVFISGVAAVHQHCRIGRLAMVAGGAMVTMDVAPFCIAQGDRGKLRGLNAVGLRRSGAGRETLKAVREAYKTVFVRGIALDAALRSPELSVADEFVTHFRTFLSMPKRGFVRPAGRGAEPEEAVS